MRASHWPLNVYYDGLKRRCDDELSGIATEHRQCRQSLRLEESRFDEAMVASSDLERSLRSEMGVLARSQPEPFIHLGPSVKLDPAEQVAQIEEGERKQQ